MILHPNILKSFPWILKSSELGPCYWIAVIKGSDQQRMISLARLYISGIQNKSILNFLEFSVRVSAPETSVHLILPYW